VRLLPQRLLGLLRCLARQLLLHLLRRGAGPCRLAMQRQVLRTAEARLQQGVTAQQQLLRLCAFKSRLLRRRKEPLHAARRPQLLSMPRLSKQQRRPGLRLRLLQRPPADVPAATPRARLALALALAWGRRLLSVCLPPQAAL
jgi:hypothetical protein